MLQFEVCQFIHKTLGLGDFLYCGGTATAVEPPPQPSNSQSIRKQTFLLCRKLKFSIEGVFNLISLISHQLVSQICCG